MVTDEAVSAPSTTPTIEQTGLQLESTSKPVFIPATSSAPATSNLQLVIGSRSLTSVVDLDSMVTSPTSLVASTLVSMKTLPWLSYVPSVLLTFAPMTPSTIVSTKHLETSPSKLSCSPGVKEVEKKFVADMIDTFYKSLKGCISLVLKGSTSPFEFLNVVLTRNIETIRDFGGTDQAASLELIVKDLEKDVDEWCHLNSSSLTPFVEEEVKRLFEHMQKTYAET